MSKVFSDFSKNNSMKRAVGVGIAIAGVIVATLVGAIIISADSEKIEVEDTFDKELDPIELPEIEKKINEIEKIANETRYEVLPREWQTSGPFQIDRKEYALGEKIFIRIGALEYEEKGQIAVMRPLNDTHYSVYLTIPFDGAKKDAFNYYLDPHLSSFRDLCTINDVLGKWVLVFRGTDYPNLNFEIINKTVPGTNWDPVC